MKTINRSRSAHLGTLCLLPLCVQLAVAAEDNPQTPAEVGKDRLPRFRRQIGPGGLPERHRDRREGSPGMVCQAARRPHVPAERSRRRGREVRQGCQVVLQPS